MCNWGKGDELWRYIVYDEKTSKGIIILEAGL